MCWHAPQTTSLSFRNHIIHPKCRRLIRASEPPMISRRSQRFSTIPKKRQEWRDDTANLYDLGSVSFSPKQQLQQLQHFWQSANHIRRDHQTPDFIQGAGRCCPAIHVLPTSSPSSHPFPLGPLNQAIPCCAVRQSFPEALGTQII